MAEEDNFDFWALLDEDIFVGLMVVQTFKTLSYLFFLAIDPSYHSMGYGSRTIETLKESYKGKKQVVDYEMPDKEDLNNTLRLRRHQFYLKNGYKETGLFLSYKSVDY